MQRIEAADFFDLADVSDPRLSPGGERVAFVRKTPRDDDAYESTIYVVDLGGDQPRQFTVAEGVDSDPRWSPSGDRLAFVSTRGGDDDRAQLWVVPTDGGEARRLTSVVGGVSGIEWSPDGSRVLFSQQVTRADREERRDRHVDPEYEPEEPDPRVIDRLVYRTAQRYVDGRRSHVYVLDVETALAGDREAAVAHVTERDVDFASPTWGDEETIYYASRRDDDLDDAVEWDLYAHPVPLESTAPDGTEPVEEIPERFAETVGFDPLIRATADGRVAYSYRPREKLTMAQVQLVVHDRTTGEEVVPTETLDRTLSHTGDVAWGPDGEVLYATTPEQGSVVLTAFPVDDGDVRTVCGEGATLTGFSVGDDAVAYVKREWDHPGDVFVATRGGNEECRLTRVNEAYLTDRAVAQPEELRWSRDGADLQGWLLTPPDFDPDETYPVVCEIHGGPHVQWTRSGTMWHEFQTLAARGYVVFWSNPRGSTGYGEAHTSAIEGDWGAVTLGDVLAGLDLVCERSFVDDDAQFVTGGSFGGYMTAWAVGQTDRFDAAVAQRGLYDLTSFYGSTDWGYRLVEFEFGATPWEGPDRLWEHSPVSLVPEVETPTLVMHAERDYRTPICSAELFYRGLYKHGVECRLVRYPREGHELSRSGEPAHVVDRLERIARWFDGYSDHHEAPNALEREPGDGLTGGIDESTEDTA